MRFVASTRTVALGALRVSARLRDRVRAPRPGVTVLIYHRVGARASMAVDLPTAQFREQIARIAGRTTTLDDALSALDGPRPADGTDPVVVTFDDGTADVVDEALPVLVEHRVPALLYVATRFIDEQVDFPHDGRPASWSSLADGLSTGYLAIGSHTHSHALLDRLDPAQVGDELDRSVGLIRERLGVDPVHFAYPKALPGNAIADAAVRSRFRSAAVAGTRSNPYEATDAYALARSPIQRRDDLRSFDAKASGGLGLEDDLRRVANRIRYRGASH